ncbi:MAG: EamA family transporter [Burkholderiales bacterium]
MFDNGIPFALAALVLFGLSDLVYKRAAMSGVPTHQLMMVQSWTYGVLILCYGWSTGSLEFAPASLWGAVAGVFAFTGFYNFAKSLQKGSVSINAPIFRLNFAITAALAMALLGESLGTMKIIGLSLAPIAVWLLAGAGGGAAERRASAESLVRVLVATVGVGIANFIYKISMAGGSTPAAMLVVQAAVAVALATIMVARLDGFARPNNATIRHALAAASLLAGAFVLLLEGLTRGEASVIVPIAQLGLIVSSLLGIFVMREAATGRKVIGILFAIGALVALASI